jgi:Polyketide cyclase / dehydrase and lipid transport
VKGYVLSVERVMAASASSIFAVLADAGQHCLIDGSGMLQGKGPNAPQELGLGTTFGMAMKMFGLPYSTVNEVVEFERDRRIAWRTGPKGPLGRMVAGRVWRYELEPEGDATRVRESWDITTDHQRVLLKLGDIYSSKTKKDMERTLERLEQLVTSTPAEGPERS